nr:hypothetical protein [Halobaculum sp. XH14]
MSHALREDGTLTESCSQCGADTPHEVGIEIRTEGSGENASFSREPYRVAECTRCGYEAATRMNDR